MNVRTFLLSAALGLAAFSFATAQSARPDYKPEARVEGTISAWGAEGMKALMARWQAGFERAQPGIRFDTELKSTAVGIAGMYALHKDIALMAREIQPTEALAFHRIFGYDPEGIVVVSGAFDVEDKTFPMVVFVHDGNPVKQLNFRQLKAVFGCGSASCGAGAAKTWGDLGATGDWARRPIHTYGYAPDSGFSFFFDHAAMGGANRWNCDLKSFDTVDAPGKPRIAGGMLILKALASDPDGIAFSGIRYPTPGTHPVAISSGDAGPYVLPTRASATDRTYPLTRDVYVYVNHKPGAPLEPKVREFLRYILSKEGQEDVTAEGDFLPLPPAMAEKQTQRLQ